jgi:hypothetical protein
MPPCTGVASHVATAWTQRTLVAWTAREWTLPNQAYQPIHSGGPLESCLRGGLHVAHLVDRHARILTLQGFSAEGIVMCLKGWHLPLAVYFRLLLFSRSRRVLHNTSKKQQPQPQHPRRADAASEILQRPYLRRDGASFGHPCVRVLSARCPLACPGHLKQAEGRQSEHRTLRDYAALVNLLSRRSDISAKSAVALHLCICSRPFNRQYALVKSKVA